MKLRILYSLHMYPPMHRAGSEYYAHNIAKQLIKRGHEVRVILHRYWGNDNDRMYQIDGVTVFPPTTSQVIDELFRWADVVYTSLDFSKWSIWKAKQLGKPCVWVAHSHSDYYDDMINSNDNTFPIHNSQWVSKILPYKRPSMVFEPIIDGDCIAENKRPEYITLVNHCELKGAKTFFELAKRMPDRKFLAVQGSYNEQIIESLPNVTYWPKSDIKKVFEVTKILLMPSEEESWSLLAQEALANGVPVICSPTPGLMENCGEGAQYLDRDNIKGFVNLIKKLDNPKEYAKWSAAGLKRTAERPNRYDELENFLYKANEYRYGR